MLLPLQISWFVGPDPALLPTWLIALGLEAMFFGGTYQVLQNVPNYQNVSRLEKTIAAGGVALGYLFLTLSVLRTAYAEYAAFLYLVFRGVEGVAATHLYVKVYNVLQGKGLGGNYVAKAKHMLGVFFIFGLGSYLALKAILGTPRVAGYWYNLSMVYTGVVAAVSVMAVRWRYRDLAKDLNTGVVGGLALCIAGAQIFGFTLAGDIALTLAGSVVYSFGFWVSAYLLWGKIITGGNPAPRSDCPNCQQTLPTGQRPQYCPHCGTSL